MADNRLADHLNNGEKMYSEASREEIIGRIVHRLGNSNRETLTRILLQLEEGPQSPLPIEDTRIAKLQAFSNRVQGPMETDSDYLAALKQLAIEAHLISIGRKRSYESYVVSQFLAGVNEGLTRHILKAKDGYLSMEKWPMLSTIESLCWPWPGYTNGYLANCEKDTLINILRQVKGSPNISAILCFLTSCLEKADSESPDKSAHECFKCKSLVQVSMPNDNPQRSAKLLEFSTRVQGKSESEREFLAAIEKLAQEADLDESKGKYKGYVVSQFMAGVGKGLSNDILAAMKTLPTFKEVKNLCKPSPIIDQLFTRNIYHVMEKIFFYLDYESYKACFGVCKTWRSFLTSETTFKASKFVFGKEMWVDTVCVQWNHNRSRDTVTSLERIKVVPDIKIMCWATNGDEVAYIGDMEEQGSSVLHYIDDKGELHSVKLKERILHEKCVHEKCEMTKCVNVINQRCVKDLWILENVILIGTYMALPTEGAADDGKVYAVTKNLMSETTLFTNFTNKETIAFLSRTCLRLLSIIFDEGSNVYVLWLRQVSMEHQRHHAWEGEGDFVTDLDCCYSVKVQTLGEDSVNKWIFSRDGTRVILAEPGNISAFAIGVREKDWKVGRLWKIEYKHGLPDSLMTNSKFLVLYKAKCPETTKFGIVRLHDGGSFDRDGKDGEDSKDFWPIWGEARFHAITERHLIVFGYQSISAYDSDSGDNDSDSSYAAIMTLTEVETLSTQTSRVNRRYPMSSFSWGSNKAAGISVFQGGNLAILLNDKESILINIAGWPEQVLVTFCRDKPQSSLKFPTKNKVTESRYHDFKPVKFQEVTNGLCVVTTERTRLHRMDDGEYTHPHVKFGYELVFLGGEKLSRALQRWVSLASLSPEESIKLKE